MGVNTHRQADGEESKMNKDDYISMSRAELETRLESLKDNLEDLEETLSFNFHYSSSHISGSQVLKDKESLKEIREEIAGLESLLLKNVTGMKGVNMYLFFDTETTGLPGNWNAPVTDLDNWPRLVQIAWLQYDHKGRKVSGRDYIIKPEGFTILDEASQIHGISTDRALQEGVSLQKVLEEFSSMIDESTFLVAHNMSFDEKIVGAEFLRQRVKNSFSETERICTMKATTDYCKLPGKYGYKWPKLSELHIKLFKNDFEEAHDASVDIAACAKCFWELKNRGII